MATQTPHSAVAKDAGKWAPGALAQTPLPALVSGSPSVLPCDWAGARGQRQQSAEISGVRAAGRGAVPTPGSALTGHMGQSLNNFNSDVWDSMTRKSGVLKSPGG